MGMNRLSTEKRAQIIGALVEGNSIRSTVRMTGAAKNTVTKLLVDIGHACREYLDGAMQDLPCKDLQLDEIWSFCYAKEKNVPEEHQGEFGYGDVYTFTALCSDCKIVPTFWIGERSGEDAEIFVNDLATRLSNRVQITTDGFRAYLRAVPQAFHYDADYAVLHKLYGSEPHGERRYSPAVCIGTDKRVVAGAPDKSRVSTSYVERQNLTMRMSMRRFTRLTNAFSKKVENLEGAVSLHFMYYNFGRTHQTLGMTPAMKAGIADHKWSLVEIAGLLD
jgi:IS1 family transposase